MAHRRSVCQTLSALSIDRVTDRNPVFRPLPLDMFLRHWTYWNTERLIKSATENSMFAIEARAAQQFITDRSNKLLPVRFIIMTAYI